MSVAHAPNSLSSGAMGSLRTRPGPFAIMMRSPLSSTADDDAVVRSVDAAVQRIERRAVGIEADDEAVGARRRPGLDDAHRLDMRALHRLLERLARAQARRDPVLRVDLRHHALPIGGLPQHELDELAAGDEGGQPDSRRRRPATAATDRPADGEARPSSSRRARRDESDAASSR